MMSDESKKDWWPVLLLMHFFVYKKGKRAEKLNTTVDNKKYRKEKERLVGL
jgi:hypothetical protein